MLLKRSILCVLAALFLEILIAWIIWGTNSRCEEYEPFLLYFCFPLLCCAACPPLVANSAPQRIRNIAEPILFILLVITGIFSLYGNFIYWSDNSCNQEEFAERNAIGDQDELNEEDSHYFISSIFFIALVPGWGAIVGCCILVFAFCEETYKRNKSSIDAYIGRRRQAIIANRLIREHSRHKKEMISLVKKLPFIKECPICCNNIAKGDQLTVLPCNPKKHFFHSDCILDWFLKNNVCPLCMTYINHSSLKISKKYEEIYFKFKTGKTID